MRSFLRPYSHERSQVPGVETLADMHPKIAELMRDGSARLSWRGLGFWVLGLMFWVGLRSTLEGSGSGCVAHTHTHSSVSLVHEVHAVLSQSLASVAVAADQVTISSRFTDLTLTGKSEHTSQHELKPFKPLTPYHSLFLRKSLCVCV